MSNLLFSTIKFNVCVGEGSSNVSNFSCGYCIARNHDDKNQEMGKSSPICSLQGTREAIIKQRTQIIVFLAETTGQKCSVRAGMAVWERAFWRYLQEGCHCDPLCKESWVKHH